MKHIMEDIKNNKNMHVKIGEKTLYSPIIKAAGAKPNFTAEDYYHFHTIGLNITKTITKEESFPNSTIEDYPIKKLPYGFINRIGLKNKGMCHYKDKIKIYNSLYSAIATSIYSKTIEGYCEIIKYLEDNCEEDAIWGWEINVGCPNVFNGLEKITSKKIEKLTSAIRKITKKPLLIKLPPDIYHIGELGEAVENGGADAVCVINSIPAMITENKHNQYTVFEGFGGGLSGEAILPIALSIVTNLFRYVKIPIIASGGITKAYDALQFFLAGASAVQIATASYNSYSIYTECYDMIDMFCEKSNIKCTEIKDIQCRGE